MRKTTRWSHQLMDYVSAARFSYLDVLQGVGAVYLLATGQWLPAGLVSLALIRRWR